MAPSADPGKAEPALRKYWKKTFVNSSIITLPLAISYSIFILEALETRAAFGREANVFHVLLIKDSEEMYTFNSCQKP